MTTLNSNNRWEEAWAEKGPRVPWALSAPEPILMEYTRKATIHRVLDLGCGHGIDARYLSMIGAQVDAIDISSTAISLAKEYDKHTNYILNDFQTHAFSDKYDFIYDRGYLGPCHDKASCVSKVKSLLSDDGKWLSLIGREDGDNSGPARYILSEVIKWFEGDFNILEITASSTLNNENSKKISLWKILAEKKYEHQY